MRTEGERFTMGTFLLKGEGSQNSSQSVREAMCSGFEMGRAWNFLFEGIN